VFRKHRRKCYRTSVFAVRVVGARDLAVGVGKQRERQVVLLGERFEVADGVVADPDDRDVGALKGVPLVAEATGLGRTSRRVGAG